MAEAEKSAATQDPSMEEILQSIRRIIADDETKGKDAPAGASATPLDVVDSDILELTEQVVEEVAAPANGADSTGSNDVLASIDSAVNAANPTAYNVSNMAPPPLATAIPADDLLVSPQAATKAAGEFRRLNETLTPPPLHVESPHLRNGTTVEDLVLELLRPMIKTWLDKNLPPMVQRIVEREVRRLASN